MSRRLWLWPAVRCLLAYVLLAPPVGLVVFALGIGGLVGWGSGDWDAVYVPAFLIVYGLAFAHVLGALPALVAGAAAALGAHLLGSRPLWLGPASGLLAMPLTSTIGALRLSPDAMGREAGAVDPLGLGVLAVMLATHLLACTAAWLAVRRIEAAGPV